MSEVKLTPQHIDEQIVSADYYTFPGTKLTVCALKLKNGYYVCAEYETPDSVEFDAELSHTFAYGAARNKIWALEKYLIKSLTMLSSGETAP